MTKTKSFSPTIRDVAQKAGVSVATVSRFINHNTPVSPEVAARLDAVMAELNYTPQATARNLATHKTHAIGLLTSDISGDFFTPLLSGIESAAHSTGYSLLISSLGSSRHSDDFPLPLGPHNTDGALVFSGALEPSALQRLAANGFPLVLIQQSPPQQLAIPSIIIENKSAAFALVEHLILVHKRKRIIFLQGPTGQEDSFWREQGYRAALDKYGIAFDPALLAAGDFDRQAAVASLRRLLAAGVDFDAVFAGDDESAVGVLHALLEAGKRLPEEVSVVGFDDQRMSPYLTPPLTTVRAPTEEVGRSAAQTLIHLISGKKVEPLVRLPAEIVIRRSCGCSFK